MKSPHGLLSLPRELFLFVLIAVAGCFYPAMSEPPPASKTTIVVPVAYDLAWDAVNNVLKSDGYGVQAKTGAAGIIETDGRNFTLDQADCGQVRTVLGRSAAEPTIDSSVVLNFHLQPHGVAATTVSVEATFTSPIHVPLHPLTDETCVSRGVEEAKVLSQIRAEVAQIHRPVFQPAN